MGLIGNKRGFASETLKIAAALLIALAVFLILLSFSINAKEADSTVSKIGADISNFTQETAFEILRYGNNTE